MQLSSLFATTIHRASFSEEADTAALNADIAKTAKMLAKEDKAGRAWCRDNGYDGYTSYASLDDLVTRATCFDTLAKKLKPHADAFAREQQWDLRGKRLKLDNLWVNVLDPGGSHSGHIHPHCVISGTYYVVIPDGASSIRFEDPRLPMMMATPTPHGDAETVRQRFVHVAPRAGDLLMWESWLRHEVPVNRAASPRVSVSFNYRLG